MQTISVVTCPACQDAKPVRMPTHTNVLSYVCPTCGVKLRPKPGGCCVFCSYGSAPCPPAQMKQGGANSNG